MAAAQLQNGRIYTMQQITGPDLPNMDTILYIVTDSMQRPAALSEIPRPRLFDPLLSGQRFRAIAYKPEKQPRPKKSGDLHGPSPNPEFLQSVLQRVKTYYPDMHSHRHSLPHIQAPSQVILITSIHTHAEDTVMYRVLLCI